MKLTINGVSVEATKEDLEKALKEFDKPVWSIKFSGSDLYGLYKNGEAETYIGNRALSFQENYAQLIYKIANAMGALASKNNILGENVFLYNIHFDKKNNVFDGDVVEDYIGGTILLSQAIDKESDIADLLNNSPLMEEFK